MMEVRLMGTRRMWCVNASTYLRSAFELWSAIDGLSSAAGYEWRAASPPSTSGSWRLSAAARTPRCGC